MELTQRQEKWLDLLNKHDECDNLYIELKSLYPKRHESKLNHIACRGLIKEYREALQRLDEWNYQIGC